MSRWQLADAAALIPAAPPQLPALCWSSRDPEGPAVRLLAVGDVGFSGRVRATGERLGLEALLAELAPVLQGGAVVLGNLETPLLDGLPAGTLYAAPTAAADALAAAGFTLLHLANNHVYDHGPGGLASTLAALAAAGLTPLGAGRDAAAASALVRTEVEGLALGWLGAGRTQVAQEADGPRYWELDGDELLAAVARAREQVDVLLVSLHLGYMFVDYPHPEHHALAERLTAAGADLVLMHHAHVLQGVSAGAGGGMVCYNLGNLLLDWQEGRVRAEVAVREQHEGAVFAFDLDRRGVCRLAVLPTVMAEDDCRVRWATGERGREILARLRRISEELAAPDLAGRFRRQHAARNTAHTLKVLWYHLRRGHLGVVVGLLRKVRPGHAALLGRWLTGRLRRRSGTLSDPAR